MDEQELQLNTAVTETYDEDSIQVLEGLQAVRKRPGMYIGSTGPRGLHHLVYEIVDNAIDEALAGFCTQVNVQILPGDIITVRDNGRGIPVGMHDKMGIPAVTVVLTVLHAGGKFGGSGYKVSGGLHGVGSSVVNALSEWLEVEVSQDGKVHRQRFARGDIATELEVVGETDQTGTLITFKPDPEVFTETTVFEFEILERRLRESAFLNAGLRITLDDLRIEAEPIQKEFCFVGGIASFAEFLNNNRGLTPLHDEAIHLTTVVGDKSAEVALQYNDSYNELLLSFANNVNTSDGGTHVNGFKLALTRVFNDYGRKFKYLKDNDKNLSGDDVREGLTAVISVKLTDAQFEGQTKGKLGNTDMTKIVSDMVYAKLMTHFEENPSVAKAIFSKALDASRAREAARKARDLARKKAGTGEGGALPGKLQDCTEKNPEVTELYIVEGDSAGGTAKKGRDPRYQAILPLWGKMLNVEKARLDKVIGNEKLIPVVLALGTGIDEDFNIEKLRYHKVIIMADADVDGAHIRTLLLTFFFRYLRPLVEEGYIYIAQPPLYRVSRGRKHHYAFSDAERDALLAEMGEGCDIQRYKGLGEMDADQIWETTMDPSFRTILRVTLEDAIAADETFSILMGDKVEPRREFIEQNAKKVKNLDI
ncbi:MAG: DNA topoisomerase (ATP-hydrolyzing) subunit B [Oscillospiraceae bacterium]|nr:DNA topoisomerase (ATP-hydrolyzing) subunit B [Oscillospiraceae bacterium]